MQRKGKSSQHNFSRDQARKKRHSISNHLLIQVADTHPYQSAICVGGQSQGGLVLMVKHKASWYWPANTSHLLCHDG